MGERGRRPSSVTDGGSTDGEDDAAPARVDPMTGIVAVPGHVLQTTDPVLVTVLLFGMVVSTVLVAVGTVAWQRRRSLPYLLVALALGTLAVKGVVGFSVLADLLPMATHHTIEHGLDLLMAILLVGAIVFARERPSGELA